MANSLSESCKDLDLLVEGFTNIPLALYDGRITSEALEGAMTKIELAITEYERMAHKPNERLLCSVIRVNAPEQEIHVFYEIRSPDHHIPPVLVRMHDTFFYTTGQLTGEKESYMSSLQHTFYPLFGERNERFSGIEEAASHARSENLAEVKRVLASVQVYPGDARIVEGKTRKQVSFIALHGSQQLVEGASLEVLQVTAYLAGCNAVIDYSRASPARGTPVLLR